MADATIPALDGWSNFYVIVGSSAAALIGLQFVVIALVNDTRMKTSTMTMSAFSTPTVVHLGGALVISSVMSAPWPSIRALSITVGACGLIGIAYATTVLVSSLRQTQYKPVLEDWLFHIIFPFTAYVAFALAGGFLRVAPRSMLFALGAAALGLLLIAIHNAWDTVMFLIARRQGEDARAAEASATPPTSSPNPAPPAYGAARQPPSPASPSRRRP
jgi:hypothetical protein